MPLRWNESPQTRQLKHIAVQERIRPERADEIILEACKIVPENPASRVKTSATYVHVERMWTEFIQSLSFTTSEGSGNPAHRTACRALTPTKSPERHARLV